MYTESSARPAYEVYTERYDMRAETAELVRSVEAYLSAAEPPTERAGALIRDLSVLFAVTAPEADDAAVERFDSLFLSLSDKVDKAARGFVAVRLSKTANAPKRTVLTLAHDDISVARPVLQHSPQLESEDLVELAIAHGLDHMAAIAERASLDVTVTDVLVFNGDDEVRRAVTGNHGAHISERGYRRLARQAGGDRGLGALIVARPDAPAVVLRFLIRRHGPALIGDRALPAPAPEARAVSANAIDALFGLFDFDEAAERLTALAAGGADDAALLRRSVSEGRFPETVILIARLGGVRVGMLVAWMTSEDTSHFLVAARAMGLPPAIVTSVLDLGPWRYALDARRRQQALRDYLAIDPVTAKQQLAGWVRTPRPASH